MTKTASIGLVPSTTLFGRFLATLDRVLMASARAAIRNGDLPYFGLGRPETRLIGAAPSAPHRASRQIFPIEDPGFPGSFLWSRRPAGERAVTPACNFSAQIDRPRKEWLALWHNTYQYVRTGNAR
jgi:hypothetical protein